MMRSKNVLNFAIPGLPILQKVLKRKQIALKKRKIVNARAVTVLDRWIQKNFQQEGGLATSGGWKPLAESTIAQRRGKKGMKILQDTGDLRKRWKHFFDDKIGKIQSGVPYAMKHEKGFGVPQRKILPTETQIMPELKKLYGHFIKTSLEK